MKQSGPCPTTLPLLNRFSLGSLVKLLYLYSCTVDVLIQNSFVMLCSGKIIPFQVHSTKVDYSVHTYIIFKELLVNNNSLY